MNWVVFWLIALVSCSFLFTPHESADGELRHLEHSFWAWCAVLGLIWLLRL